MKPLWSQSIYRYVLLYIVDNTGGHDIDYGRKELMNYLSFFSYEHLNESFLLTWAVVAVDETSGSSEWPSTRYIARNSVRGWSYINLLVLPCPSISWVFGYWYDCKTSTTFPDRVNGEGFTSARLCPIDRLPSGLHAHGALATISAPIRPGSSFPQYMCQLARHLSRAWS